MSLNTFQKNALFTIAALSVVVVSFLGIRRAYSAIAARGEQARIVNAKARVARVMKLNICAHFTDGEQARLDKAATDPEETKAVLLAVHRSRSETWTSNVKACESQVERLISLHNSTAYYINYMPEIRMAKEDLAKASEQATTFAIAVLSLSFHDVNAPLDDKFRKH